MKAAKKKRVVKYIHTLDGQPANFTTSYGPHLEIVSGARNVELVDSLCRIRSERDLAIEEAAEMGDAWGATFSRYSYVRVYVD